MESTVFEDVPMSQDSSQLYFDAVEVMSSASEWSDEEETVDQSDHNNPELDGGTVVNQTIVDLTDDLEMDLDVEPKNEDEFGQNDGLNGIEGDGAKVKLQGKILKPRNYQLEMLEESLKRNIIVAMDTGSGKTHIAVLRIAAELERAPPNKLVWFMAPTVALCEQQHGVLEEQLSSVHIKFLSGTDNVDHWSTKELWDAVLLNVRVVVSPYQILLDALTHAFVSLDSIVLIVFDEAHNCVGLSPGSQIMRDFYMPKFVQGHEVPHILGLSASPIMNSSILSLPKIEETLNSICRTPSKHRAELLQQVKLPEAKATLYVPWPQPEDSKYATATLASLHKVYENLDVQDDPYVRKLKLEDTDKSLRRLKKAFMSRGTYCQDQFKSLCTTSTAIFHELGGWAADFYVSNAIARFTNITESTASYFERLDFEEKSYLAAALEKVYIVPESMTKTYTPNVSDKVDKLIKTLLEIYHSGISSIVFVERRATVAVLAHLLSVHPDTKDLYNVGTFVGTSQDPRRITNIGDVLNIQNQWKALEDFRNGTINLIVATSALEEGIDVPACNTVICFNEPPNLKVLVQRRGRARSLDSKLILMFDNEKDKVDKWLEFEKYMKQVYADDMRKLKEIETLENLHEPGHREFRVEKTGALLNLDNAVQHLYHFCATLPADEYVDLRPDFICEKIDEIDESDEFDEFDGINGINKSYVKAKVILPPCVPDLKCRYAEGQQAWPSERDAIRDAAFEACVMLYRAGLINDHLLPLLRHKPVPETLEGEVESRSSQVSVSAQLNPWVSIARLWSEQTEVVLHKSIVRVTTDSGTLLSEMAMILPTQLPDMAPISIYWDAMTTLRVTILPASPQCAAIQANDITRGRMETAGLIKAVYGHRFTCDQIDFPAIFITDSSVTSGLLRDPERKLASDFLFPDVWEYGPLLIRDTLDSYHPYLYHKWLASKPDYTTIRRRHGYYDSFEQDVPYLALKPLSKRRDFLHVIPLQNKVQTSVKPFYYALPSSVCLVDKLPFSLVQFGLLLPSILHRIQVQLVASVLSTTLLRDVAFSNIQLLITAISTPGAREQENYERLEFLGDSVLKICTTVQLLTNHPTWHEGYLSGQKDRFVCNARLSRAAGRESGLDKFILTKPFTGNKWRPAFISDLLQAHEGGKRKMSTKMLADVVEALLGAAMVDGGFSKAVACLRVFIPEPEINWQPINTNRDGLFNLAPLGVDLPTTLNPLEDLIGYTFQKKTLLIESMTHVSYTTAKTASLERLEFLGDSVLDSITTDKVFNHTKQLPVYRMHLLRTALVNADFLAFMCMELALDQEKVELVENKITGEFEKVKSKFSLPLWKFMRHTCPAIAKAQQATVERYRLLRDDIMQAIHSSDHYPWILLARLRAPKFFSDIVESLLGAIWIDSGSLGICEALLERMRILPYLRRIVEDDVHLLHPKEELGLLAVDEKVRYVIGVEKKDEEDGVKETSFCEVFVGERLRGRGKGPADRELLTGIAAEMAVARIKAEKGI